MRRELCGGKLGEWGAGEEVSAEISPPVSLSRPLLHRGDRSYREGCYLLLHPPHRLPACLSSCGVHYHHHHTLPTLTPTSPHHIKELEQEVGGCVGREGIRGGDSEKGGEGQG